MNSFRTRPSSRRSESQSPDKISMGNTARKRSSIEQNSTQADNAYTVVQLGPIFRVELAGNDDLSSSLASSLACSLACSLAKEVASEIRELARPRVLLLSIHMGVRKLNGHNKNGSSWNLGEKTIAFS